MDVDRQIWFAVILRTRKRTGCQLEGELYTPYTLVRNPSLDNVPCTWSGVRDTG
jgi:hypothetical protein